MTSYDGAMIILMIMTGVIVIMMRMIKMIDYVIW